MVNIKSRLAKSRSFKTVVNEKFIDAIEKAVSTHIDNNFHLFEFNSYRVKRVDEAFLADAPLQLHRVIPYETLVNKLNFDAIVIAQIEIFQNSHSQSVEDDVEKWFRVACDVSFYNGFDNLQINDICDYDARENSNNKSLSDTLVPFISTRDLEKHATEILQKVYPEALLLPQKVDARIFADNLGLQIEERHLSRNGSIFGQMIFHDSTVEYFDLDNRRFNTINAVGGTVFVDPEIYFLRSLGSWNNTVIHECVHWLKHRLCIELERFYNENISRISCQATETTNSNEKDRSDTEWMEWHANSLAPRILMPYEPFKKKATEIIDWYKKDRQTNKICEFISSVIYELAEFFEVSVQSAKIRLMDLGYMEAAGVLEYIDGEYKTNHSFKEGAVNRNQTFSIPMISGLHEYGTNFNFKRVIDTGNFVYIDSHYCINDPKYVVQNEYDLLEMTDYAISHMDECCLVFERSVHPNSEYGVKQYSECVLFQSAVATTITDFKFNENEYNNALEAYSKELSEVRERTKILTELPSTFNKSLIYLMKWRKITVEKLAEQSLCSAKTIQRLRNEPNRDVPLEIAIALCIGLQLDSSISLHMLEKAGHKLRFNERDLTYDHILKTRNKSSIYECNELLGAAGFPILGTNE